MQHFDAGNYHVIYIHKCLFIQSTAVARELYGDNSSAVCDRGGHTCMELGFSSNKPEQVEVAVALIEHRRHAGTYLLFYPRVLVKASVMLACQWHFINARRKSEAIPLSL